MTRVVNRSSLLQALAGSEKSGDVRIKRSITGYFFTANLEVCFIFQSGPFRSPLYEKSFFLHADSRVSARGAMVVRLTTDQKAKCSKYVGVSLHVLLLFWQLLALTN